jgi:hypothetical protein
MNRRWKILIWVLVVGGVVLLPVMTHYRAKAAVERYRKQLQNQGEKVTIDELTPPLSKEGENGGPALLQAARILYYVPTNAPPAMKVVAPGRVMVAWAEAVLPSEKSTNIWPKLTAEIEALRGGLAGVRAALEYPKIQFDLNYSLGWATPLAHLAPVKCAEQWLSAATLLELHEGQASNAWGDLKCCVAEVRLYRCEPIIISHLVRIACGQIALATTWEALQYPGWSDGQLAELQKSWEAVDYGEGAEPTFSMERAMMAEDFDDFRNSYSNYTAPGNFLGGGPPTADNLSDMAERYPRYWGWKYWVSYEEELYAWQSLPAALDAARQLQSGGALIPALEKLRNAGEEIRRVHARGETQFVLGMGRTDSEAAFLTRIMEAEMARKMLITAIAIKRYQLQHGKYPEQLPDLVPQFLHEAPMDVMDGKPLRYKLRPDGDYLLYSVGEDGMDNGGDASSLGNGSTKNWLNARDIVWPRAATAAEVEEYESRSGNDTNAPVK